MQRGRRPSRRGGLVVIGLGVVLTSCFTTSADFSSDAEKYIRSGVADALDVEFVEATCEEPPTQDIGTKFTCTATDVDGGMWEFENVIDAKNEYTVDITRQPVGP